MTPTIRLNPSEAQVLFEAMSLYTKALSKSIIQEGGKVPAMAIRLKIAKDLKRQAKFLGDPIDK